MALQSPGVEVQVINESFYVPAGESTRPLLVLATAENKTNGSGTGIATGTLKANANKPYFVNSQRELTELFGTPKFHTDASGNPIHGGELNEYGLQAAYSFLGIANSAFILRADLDLSQLNASADAPTASPSSGVYWLDTQNTQLGVFQWNGSPSTSVGGQQFANKAPTIITDSSKVTPGGAPISGVGVIGDYALVATSNLNKLYFKNRGVHEGTPTWVLVGTPEWHKSWSTVKATKSPVSITIGNSIYINGTLVTASGTTVASFVNDISAANIRGVSAKVVDGFLEIYSDGAVDSPQMDSTASNAIVIAAGTGTLVAPNAANSVLGIAVGTYYGPILSIGPHTQIPRFKTVDDTPRPTGSVWIKTTNVNLGANWSVKLWNTTTLAWNLMSAPMYSNAEEALYKIDLAGGGKNIPVGSLYVQYNFGEDSGSDATPRLATFKIYRRNSTTATSFLTKIIEAGTLTNGSTYTFTMAETKVGVRALQAFKTISFQATGTSADANRIAQAVNAAGFDHVEATVDSRNRVVISHKSGGDMRLRNGTNNPFDALAYVPFNITTNEGTVNLYQDPQDPNMNDPSWFIASNWKPLSYTASMDQPTSLTDDGRLWYSSVMDEVDIMIHDGTNWVGYLSETSPFYNDANNGEYFTDPNGPIVTATKPTKQSDSTTLRNGDLWLDSGDVENYPALYKWDEANLLWRAIDNTDQTTENGIVFADARFNTTGANSNEAGAIVDLLVSDFVDFDAPDPDLYPRGTLLFNTRRSGFNVKRFVRNYININNDNVRMNDASMATYYPHRWVNESGNAANGAGLFGRKAQRKVVVKHLKAVIDSNQDIRDNERNPFTLIASPGYPELIPNMVNLNVDRRQTAFIVGDTPFRLSNDSTSLNEWGSNAAMAVEDGEHGLVTFDEYLGVYYPSGYTTDNLGNNVVVPPSHMVLRTIALSDSISYPWFAPAGTQRGVVNNVSSIGFVNKETGEFQSVALNEGQRDTLYAVKINPITFLTGSGIVVFGQKTRARAASALDRINVSRLVVYLRGQLDKLAQPYIFEPNDRITRDELKASADSLMLELLGKRAIYDFLTVCDESNNTPTRIDRNELYLDIAIEPVKAVEFIYIPLRLKNTGEIQAL